MTWTNDYKSVCITAIVRLALIYRPDPKNSSLSSTELLGLSNLQTVDVIRGLPWSNIHLGTALISACLPTYRPILSKIAHGFLSIGLPYKSWFSSKQKLNNSEESPYTMDGSRSQKPGSGPVSSNGDDQKQILELCKSSATKNSLQAAMSETPNHIMFQSTVSVV